MLLAHRFTWLFGLQSLIELKACSPLALYYCAVGVIYHQDDPELPQGSNVTFCRVCFSMYFNQICWYHSVSELRGCVIRIHY